MKRGIVYIKFVLGLMIIFMASDLWASEAFRCYAQFDNQKIELVYASPEETYMASGELEGLKIDTIDNASNCYSVQVTDQQGKLVSSATLPYFEDALLQIGHRGSRLLVRCEKVISEQSYNKFRTPSDPIVPALPVYIASF